MGFLTGKKLLITGVLSNRSIAYGIAKACHAQGAELAFSYVGERFKDRITEFAADFNSTLIFDCDVGSDEQIDRLFAAPDVAGIMAALADDPGEFAAETLKVLRRNSPLSMALTLAMVESPAAAESVRSAIAQEYRAVCRLVPEGDFLEGVRAQIIDKDRSPRWQHAGPEEVPMAMVLAMLAPLGDDELDLEEM